MEKKNKRKFPDSVVYNEELGIFDAFSKAYPTSLGSPNFKALDLTEFKNGAITKYRNKFNRRVTEIQSQIEDLFQEYEDNVLVWSSSMAFEPYAGLEIYVYDNKGKIFSSLISPEEWGNKYDNLGKFILESDFSWKRIN